MFRAGAGGFERRVRDRMLVLLIRSTHPTNCPPSLRRTRCFAFAVFLTKRPSLPRLGDLPLDFFLSFGFGFDLSFGLRFGLDL